jgi:hypothetical protein
MGAELNLLRRRMIEDMKVHNMSPVTRRCYVTRPPNSLNTSNSHPTGRG